MIIEVSNKLRFVNPTDELKQWCEKNLVIDNPEYDKKLRMGFWLGNTPEKLTLYEVIQGIYVLPYGCLAMLPKNMLENNLVISNFAEHKSMKLECDVPLYPYQQTAVSEMLRHDLGILQSQAGSGKTQMGIALAIKLGKPTLWLCHTLDLVKQSRSRAEQYVDKSLIGEISGGKVEIGKLFTFATVQTMSNLDLAQYRDVWETVIVDECHRVAGTPTSLTMYSKVLNRLSAKHKYGLSATVHRADGMIAGTYSLLGKVAYHVPEEAIAGKVVDVTVKPISTGYRLDADVLDTDGTIVHAKLINSLCDDVDRTLLIAEYLYIERGKSCLILSDRIRHMQAIMKMLPASVVNDAVLIDGKTKKEDREKAIEDMRTGKKKYLFATYALAKEGLDIPRLERLFLATPQKDYAVITQAIGRVARQFEGKAEPLVYDFVDSVGYLERMFRQRLKIYKRNNCKLFEEDTTNG